MCLLCFFFDSSICLFLYYFYFFFKFSFRCLYSNERKKNVGHGGWEGAGHLGGEILINILYLKALCTVRKKLPTS